MKRLAALLITITAALVLLAACGGGDNTSDNTSSSPSKGQGFNDADVRFATDMIPHHAQALSMIDLTVGKELSPEVAALAEGIRMAQSPEIELMAGWLEKWGKPVPPTSRDHASHDMTSMDMPGMASMTDMASLENAEGEQFEQRFLSMMIEHHQGAIAMAQTELDEGLNASAVTLAEDIIAAQQREVIQMEPLLAN